MSENCSGNCSSCSENCSSRTNPESFIKEPHELSKIKKVIGVVSGKGGVGKSLVTSLLASNIRKRGYKSAILDADITGPSIPQAFGLTESATGSESGIYPVTSRSGIPVMSINVLLPDPESPVVWRGPVIAGTLTQFWTDVIWGDVDVMFIDMPPGTGDVPLTVFQSIPLDGIIIVTTPQSLVSMVVAKAYNMAKMMKVPVLGIVENMGFVKCPDCGKEIEVFGKSQLNSFAARLGTEVIDRVPVDPQLAAACDAGEIEDYDGDALNDASDFVEKFIRG